MACEERVGETAGLFWLVSQVGTDHVDGMLLDEAGLGSVDQVGTEMFPRDLRCGEQGCEPTVVELLCVCVGRQVVMPRNAVSPAQTGRAAGHQTRADQGVAGCTDRRLVASEHPCQHRAGGSPGVDGQGGRQPAGAWSQVAGRSDVRMRSDICSVAGSGCQ